MPSGIRLQRIADRIRQELSEMLIHEISDPRSVVDQIGGDSRPV